VANGPHPSTAVVTRPIANAATHSVTEAGTAKVSPRRRVLSTLELSAGTRNNLRPAVSLGLENGQTAQRAPCPRGAARRPVSWSWPRLAVQPPSCRVRRAYGSGRTAPEHRGAGLLPRVSSSLRRSPGAVARPPAAGPR
jgi:hypothetical protein